MLSNMAKKVNKLLESEALIAFVALKQRTEPANTGITSINLS